MTLLLIAIIVLLACIALGQVLVYARLVTISTQLQEQTNIASAQQLAQHLRHDMAKFLGDMK